MCLYEPVFGRIIALCTLWERLCSFQQSALAQLEQLLLLTFCRIWWLSVTCRGIIFMLFDQGQRSDELRPQYLAKVDEAGQDLKLGRPW